jgi:para-aminobenzoate synthetase component I
LNKDFVSFPITGFGRVKAQMLNWLNQFNICCFLDNHQYRFEHHHYECLAGAGALHQLESGAGHALEQLDTFRRQHSGWLFGHLGYDLKNETEGLHSSNTDNLHFPDLFFFVPEVILLLSETELAVCSNTQLTAQHVFDEILQMSTIAADTKPEGSLAVQSRFTRHEYIETVEALRSHILRGDCYEINFCQEFFATGAQIDTLKTYHALSAASPNPFAAYYKINDKYLLCASPERYLQKRDSTITSQPIKGTWKRDLLNVELDNKNKEELFNSTKDRSENVMVVDLVRNDLAKVCEEGTVVVEELFGIYSFPQVHQMISTISGRLKSKTSLVDIIRATFPMGSMTGAPKRKVVELIEKYEKTRRGIFSGAVGYLSPNDDFDFNVVIRSILYNQSNQYLSYQVGSGITFYSNPSDEYEECLLKAAAIKKVLG